MGLIPTKEIIVAAVRGMKPPAHDADPVTVQAWRWFLAVVTGGTAVALILHVLLACGYATFMYPGFVKANEFQELKQARINDRQTDLETKILDTQEKLCKADPAVRSLYLLPLSKMLVEYQRLTGVQYPLPACVVFQ